MKNGRATLSGRLRRLAAADRDDLGAGRERVQPLGRGRHPGADDGDARRVLVRLVGVDRARVGGELVRHREARVARGDEDVPEDAVAADLEAVRDGRDPLDPGDDDALVPAAPLAQLGDVAEELVHGRPVAVAGAEHERREVASPQCLAHREPRERGRSAVPVALRAHPPLPDRGRRGARRPDGAGRRDRRVGVRGARNDATISPGCELLRVLAQRRGT